MLVLKRKAGDDGIRIDDDVLIQILDVFQWKNGSLTKVDDKMLKSLEISVGIAAPETRVIRRGEVWAQIQTEKAGGHEAAKTQR
jgi:sRNA-binding carbon storage regulator CsrA